jgi:hypothetical protein
VKICALLLLVVFAQSCSDEHDPTEPEDAYLIFREALFEGDAEGVWNRSAPETHQYFQEHYERLVEMDEKIVKYLPQTDHNIARRQSGTELISEVEDGHGLFLKVFRKPSFPDEKFEAIELGSQVEEIEMSKDQKFANLKTKGGQTWVMARGDDEQWYVRLVESNDAVNEQMEWLTSNDEALEQTIEDLISEERERREKIIAELMGYESETSAAGSDGSDTETN